MNKVAGKSLYKTLPKERISAIIADYKNNISIHNLENKYGYSRPAISRLLEEAGIKTTKGNHYRKYFHQEDYFEVIDTEEKAYWLGFLYADGYIVDHDQKYGQDQVGLSQAEDNKESVEAFKYCIQATNPITVDNSGSHLGKQRQYRLLLTSQKTVDDLIKHGCAKQKTLVLEPPNDVPDPLIRHFLRGFFDGDGALCRCPKKNSSYIDFAINFTTTRPVAEWIHNLLGFGSIHKDNRREFTWYYTTNSNPQTIKLYRFLYDDAHIYMERKYKRFQELLDKYD